jgi:PemK-like, MazF-like toxin of type II toxin-antitoxin system
MALPEPQPGLVISYSYLWRHELRAGHEEGRKDRPCVIVLTVERDGEAAIVTVVPVTHTPPSDLTSAFEIPAPVKRHLGLDDSRSWIMLDEGNRFEWPGHDLRPNPFSKDRYGYGFLPPKLFESLARQFSEIWAKGQGSAVPRS